MDAKSKHLIILKSGIFGIEDHIAEGLSDEEFNCVLTYGNWFIALEEGRVELITEKQEDFVRVAIGHQEPDKENIYQWSWYKYKKRVDFYIEGKIPRYDKYKEKRYRMFYNFEQAQDYYEDYWDRWQRENLLKGR
jgi:uncharacterized protein YifE (UPF0438 family)